ncbi:MAG: right-handed parallel beta-helix repeat-containing protein [Candidatus Krumholzibacteriota bacterium]|nr:right-handed parallel beta-helix repeat-containing protein [Candidatus Krumholzibacteriota bacterium]
MDAAADGDTVMLADGTYTGEGNRDLETYWRLTLCSQSGNPDACIIDCEGDGPEWHDCFSFFGTSCVCRIEGLTITRGWTSGVVKGGNLAIAHCVFSGNLAPCVHCLSVYETEYTLDIEDCRFEDNEGTGVVFGFGTLAMTGCRLERNPGAMYLGPDCAATLTGCTFADNTADHGGAITLFECDLTCDQCEFDGNVATNKGGALKASGEVSVHMLGCLFSGNEAWESGGVADIRTSTTISLIVEGCDFIDNFAHDNGGAFVLDGILSSASVAFTGCRFLENYSLQNGGAIVAVGGFTIDLEDCLFVSNTGGLDGGALYSVSSDVAVENYVFIDNDAQDGAALYCSGGAQATLARTILASNRDVAVYCSDQYGDSEAVLSCCDVFGNTGGDWEGCLAGQLGLDGNFSADPQFCGVPGSGNFHLQSDSPCAPGNHPGGADCGLIGALPVGCDDTAVRNTSWTAVKALY